MGLNEIVNGDDTQSERGEETGPTSGSVPERAQPLADQPLYSVDMEFTLHLPTQTRAGDDAEALSKAENMRLAYIQLLRSSLGLNISYMTASVNEITTPDGRTLHPGAE